MRPLRFALPLVIAFALVGCGPGDKDAEMPDVTGKKLDVAYDKLKDAGFDDKDKVKIEGGGTFGVVVESNWTVCEQSPPAGKPMPDEPKLTVDRSCDGDEEEGQEPSEAASESPSESPSEEPSGSPSDEPTPTEEPTKPATPTESATPELPEILTAENSPELAAVLKVSDYCDNTVAALAKKYPEQTIQFDGSIVNVAPHGSNETRFDFLVGPGDKGPNTTIGPAFQFSDKNAFDMNVTGKKIPDFIKAGQKYTFIADVDSYSPKTCLFQLEPVETKVR